MSLLLSREALAARRHIAGTSLSTLATGLRDELQPLLDHGPRIPREKALLSRTGGRCPHDGTLLTFHPFDSRHRCAACGAEIVGEAHDRFRPYWSQLWLAERSLHSALLGVLLDDRDCLAMAERILDEYADRYLAYPNSDNVLGPSRPFFSTYLESIWLLQLVLALDLLETGAGASGIGGISARMRERILEPSLELIASYDEGMSNRQVWNNAALIAGGAMLGRGDLVERALAGPSGIDAHLEHALLGDGSWYEGENYHLFAHRGLWYGLTMSEHLGLSRAPSSTNRFEEGFAAPLRTLLPDLTFPSRRDSQYAISVRQPRFAEWCELGLARHDDARLSAMLGVLYSSNVPRGETGRSASTADVERNVAPTALTRADLSWRGLLFARPTLPDLPPHAPVSELLPAQGFAAIRREGGRVFVGFDYGHSGGGHGHPDRLNLILCDEHNRWFDDPGTGSYVDDSLAWYRSTLAHQAPLLDRQSQPRVNGSLLAFDDDGASGWVRASAPLAPNVDLVRTVVVMADYLVDLLTWSGERIHDVAMPMHGVEAVRSGEARPEVWPEPILWSERPEDGISHLRDTARVIARDPELVQVAGAASDHGDGLLDGWVAMQPSPSWWRATAPGAPGRARRSLTVVHAVAARGRSASVWSWRGNVERVASQSSGVVVHRRDGSVHEHEELADGWRVTLTRGDARSIIRLGGSRPDASEQSESPRVPLPAGAATLAHATPVPAEFRLGESSYRRSEATWREAGSPEAFVFVSAAEDAVTVRVVVPASRRCFVAVEAANPFDNEPAATNGDGVQLYVRVGERTGAWLLVPRPESSRVGARPIDGWGRDFDVEATWAPSGPGYELHARIPLAGAREIELDVVVNETVPERSRRRGQLVLSGGGGEFVYLRGDRHDSSRLLRFSLPND